MEDISTLVATYGQEAKKTLNGPGEPEAALSRPVANLIQNFGREVLGRSIVLHEEVRESSGLVRPDFGVRVDGLMSGHVELKKPGTSLNPNDYGKTSHNFVQWQKLKHLPNLLHTNGTEWRLWRFGEPVAIVHMPVTSLTKFKGKLEAPNSLATLFSDFLTWTPTPIKTVSRLVETISPLAALLREEVIQSIRSERKFSKKQGGGHDLGVRYPFIGLKRDWRASLYPQATDDEFADGFAQTVVFALVTALSEGADFGRIELRDISDGLEEKHSLLGRSLDLLTEHMRGSSVGAVIETIVRALSATDWMAISGGRQDVYLHLYEYFLSSYDPELRKKSGSYYTPVDVVTAMTRLTDEALVEYLGIGEGLASEDVSVIDPAMGTGTYPLGVIQHVANRTAPHGGGAVSDAVSSVAKRIYGIELQSGPFSVAELRLSQAIRDYHGELPDGGLNLYVADTLEDPRTGTARELSYTLQLIAEQRQRANRVTLESEIQVCIGNPPYKDKSQGLGGWVELGDSTGKNALLDDFRAPGNGKFEYVLKNLYVYFWRWAMWKVFESTPSSTEGVVCFITATGYLNGPGFKGMREWIRRNTSEGWIINLTPEGKQPPAKNAVFNIETPVAIGLFLRNKENNPEEAANVRYIELAGTRAEKFHQLRKLHLSDPKFEAASTEWEGGFYPKASDEWMSFPALNDFFPWSAPGVKPNKTWVYAPESEVLHDRWQKLIKETDLEQKRIMFKETDSTSLTKAKSPLPGTDTEQQTSQPVAYVQWPNDPKIVQVGYRSFDRQYLIADSRLLHRPSPPLWSTRSPEQIFVVEQHAHFPKKGPGLVFTSLIPDMDHFNNRGGRVLPLFHPDGSTNTAKNALQVLSRQFSRSLEADELLAYIAGVCAHPAYVETFSEELHSHSNRVPITSDTNLWNQAVKLGNFVIWLHTFGERGIPLSPLQDVRDSSGAYQMPTYQTAVGREMPEEVLYNEETRTIHLGTGVWTNVMPEVWNYRVGGNSVVEAWVGYRRKSPRGRKTSPLNDVKTTSWPTEWSTELSRLLAILTHLVHLEGEQALLLKLILENPQLSKDDMEDLGVHWPKTNKDRKPKFPIPEGDTVFDR